MCLKLNKAQDTEDAAVPGLDTRESKQMWKKVQISGTTISRWSVRVSSRILLAESGALPRPSHCLSIHVSSSRHKEKHYTYCSWIIMPISENKARSLRGELYHAFTPELVAERRRCARACTAYNKAEGITRRQQVELWKE